MKRLFFLTGRPGIGKTTVLLKGANGLKQLGYSVGGMLSMEARNGYSRVGFEVVDFTTGRRGWLAHVNQQTGPQVSKYRVNLEDLNSIGVMALQKALENAEIVVVDEIGPMELFSAAFRHSVQDLIDSRKLVLGVIHRSARDQIVDSIRIRSDAELVEVTMENRERLHNLLIQRAIQFLKDKRNQTGL